MSTALLCVVVSSSLQIVLFSSLLASHLSRTVPHSLLVPRVPVVLAARIVRLAGPIPSLPFPLFLPPTPGMTTYNTTLCTSWNPEHHYRVRSNLLPTLCHYRLRERTWNTALTNLVGAPFKFTPTPLHPPQFGYIIGEETDLWESSLADGTTFRDVPMQLCLVEMVQKRKHGANWKSAKRFTIGTHIADLTTGLCQEVLDDSETTLSVTALAGEIKVTRLGRRNGKLVVVIDPDDDKELQGDTGVTHHSVPSAAGDEDKIVRADGQAKWSTGLCKCVIYLQSQFEYCSGYLSVLVLGSRFARLVMVESGHVVIEVSSSFTLTTPTLPLRQFIDNPANATHLPWDLCTVDTSRFPNYNWDHDAYERLRELHRTAADILTAHTACHPDQPFCRLRPVRDLEGASTLLQELGITEFATTTAQDLDRERVLQLSRKASKNGKKGSADSDSHNRPNGGSGEGNGDGGSGRNGGNSGRGGNGGTPPSTPRQGPTTRSQSTHAKTHEPNPSDAPQSEMESKVEQWRHSITAEVSPDSTMTMEIATPPDPSDDSTMAGDRWDNILEAHDLALEDPARAPEWVKQFVARDSDCDSDSEAGEHVLLEDMLNAIEERKIMVTLVGSAAMDKLITAIGTAVRV